LDNLSVNADRPYDVVFCRNLMIYLNQDAQHRLISLLAECLAPHGLLFVGHAENLNSFRSQFRRVSAPHAFALRLLQTDERESSIRPSPPPRPRLVSASAKSTPIVAKPSGGVQASVMPFDPPPLPTDPPAGLTATLEQARALADAGHLAPSMKAAETMLARDGPSAETLELLGYIHLALGDLSKAQDALTKALYFEPDRETVLLMLAMIHQRMGDDASARRYRQRAARSHQTDQNERQP
jgi:chemotaxis protein methyltransferase WspC